MSLARSCLRRHAKITNWNTSCNLHRISMATFHQSSSSKLPIIDISSFLSCNTAQRTPSEHEPLIKELIEVASNVGFFYITGFDSIVQPSLISSTFDQLRLFFHLPLEQKMKIHASNTQYLRGYLRSGEQGYYGLDETDKRLDANDTAQVQQERHEKDLITDTKEVFTMGTELDLQHPCFHPLLFGPNVFPNTEILPEFASTIQTYYDSVLTLSNHLYQLFAIALKLECGYFDDKISQGMNSMNCNYYMALPAEHRVHEHQFGIGEHTDYECFTVLAQDIHSPSGLEVFMDNGEWRRFEPIPNTFVINFGDIMARWSNDMFRSTVHRAVNDEQRDRYSIAFFRHCNFDINISNLKRGEADKYPPVIAGQHMLDRVERANKPLF